MNNTYQVIFQLTAFTMKKKTNFHSNKSWKHICPNLGHL